MKPSLSHCDGISEFQTRKHAMPLFHFLSWKMHPVGGSAQTWVKGVVSMLRKPQQRLQQVYEPWVWGGRGMRDSSELLSTESEWGKVFKVPPFYHLPTPICKRKLGGGA